MSDHDIDPTRADVPTIADPDATQLHDPVPGPDGGEPPYGGPPPGGYGDEPDRRPWIVAAVLAAIVVILLLLLLLDGGDDDDDATDASSTTTTGEPTSTTTSTTSSTTTTTTAPTTTTTPPVVTVPPLECAEAGEAAAKPGLAADAVYQAWVRGDKACAAALMTPASLDELFSRPGAEASDEFQGCSEEDIPDPHVDCAFTYEGGATHYLMNFSDSDGWKVYDIDQFAD